MRQSPELKPNIWDGLVVLVILALAMFAALAVWRGTDSGSAPLVTVTADGTELDRFAPECRVLRVGIGSQAGQPPQLQS